MNRVVLFFVSSVIAIMLGWGIGSYITYNNTIEAVGKIPGSPIVIGAVYDKPTHSVVLSIMNPGTLPLTVKEESFIFKPGKQSSQQAYTVEHIPVNIPLIPMGITTVAIKLKKGTPELKTGDIVKTTLKYVHPLSKDEYFVKHGYEYGVSDKKEGK
ncbi:hypothetical protein [Persephonella sp. KM09-Lau-8]|uniref:hypothetical protein n=1 Tax=Persephonella sp. KM09-Lau-8 TaxID=1158345 RepID=UPI0004950678|nr:hypothetical protein [Persephonella sp. KM09-Lau-8]